MSDEIILENGRLGRIVFEYEKPIYIPEVNTLLTADNLIYGANYIRIPEGVLALDLDLFRDNDKLVSIELPESLRVLGQRCFLNCVSLQRCKLGNSIEILPSGCFQGCFNLEEINMPRNLTRINDFCFQGCVNLKSIDLSETRVSLIGNNVFQKCTNMNKFKFPIESTRDVFDFGVSCFSACVSLESIVLPSNIVYLPSSMFLSCLNLKDIVIESETLETIYDRCFKDCKSLERLKLPLNVETIHESCFDECISMVSIQLSNELKLIGERCFSNCSSLISIDLPISLTDIGLFCFEKCISLQKIIIPNNSDLTIIHEGCFHSCKKLQEVYLPANIFSIEKYAFFCCYNLTTLTILASDFVFIDKLLFSSESKLLFVKTPNFSLPLTKQNAKLINQIKPITVKNFEIMLILSNLTTVKTALEIFNYYYPFGDIDDIDDIIADLLR